MSKELKIGVIVLVIIVAFIWGFNFLKGHDLLDGKHANLKLSTLKLVV